MTRFVRLPATVACMVLLAGCQTVPEATDAPAAAAEQVTDVPTWAIGDWWSFQASSGASYTLVVSGETASDWIIDTNYAPFALFNAEEPVSNLGPQRKSDLAGSQGDARVAFFRWPLGDGQQWSTPWDGGTFDITATVAGDAFTFEARHDGALRVVYTYDAEAKWFGSSAFLDENGTEQFASTLTEWGHNYTGPLLRYELTTLREGAVTGPGEATWVVPADLDDQTITYDWHCSQPLPGRLVVSPVGRLAAEEANRHMIDLACPQSNGTLTAPAIPGDWGLAVAGYGAGTFDVVGRQEIRWSFPPAT